MVDDGLEVGDEVTFLSEWREGHGGQVERGVEGSEELDAVLGMKLGACVVVSFDFEGRLSLNLDGDFVFVTI